MKVSLMANISANGKVLLSENTSYQAPQEAVGIFMEVATRAGNLIIGKKTFDMLLRVLGDVKGAFPGVELVLISAAGILTNDYKVVDNPEAAIDYLTANGYQEIAVGGGTITYNAFLEKDLITDIYFNIHPVMVGNGGVLVEDDALTARFKLVSYRQVGESIVQVHWGRQIG